MNDLFFSIAKNDLDKQAKALIHVFCGGRWLKQ